MYTDKNFRLYSGSADKTDGDYIFNFDTSTKYAIINGTVDLRGDTIFRGNSYSTGYYAHKYNGGNATFAIYSNFQKMGDGVSMGYNKWIENGEWAYSNTYYNTRFHISYNEMTMIFGSNKDATPAYRVFTAAYNQIYMHKDTTFSGAARFTAIPSAGATLPAGYKNVCVSSNGTLYAYG